MGTKYEALVQIFHFIGYACWAPIGTVVYRHSLGEYLGDVNWALCVILLFIGVLVHALVVWITPNQHDEDELKYKIIGVR